MRIVFMGSPLFAVPSLRALLRARLDVVAAYCQPPRPAGRGKAKTKTAVHEYAEKYEIPVFTPASLRDEEARATFASHDADLAVVAAYGLILPKAILTTPRIGCINIHASLLPRWRGAAPVQRAILAGDTVSGVTIMQMDESLDTGPILLQRKMKLEDKNFGKITADLARLGAEALLEWLWAPTPGEAQPETGITYSQKIDKSETRIDWSKSAEDVVRQVRAFAPVPGAWFEVKGERVRLLAAAAGDGGGGKPGEVIDDRLSIACGSGSIRPLQVQRAGRGELSPEDFLRGFPIPKGTILP
jgi:methionyl-tRNA formyltransferase